MVFRRRRLAEIYGYDKQELRRRLIEEDEEGVGVDGMNVDEMRRRLDDAVLCPIIP